MARSSHSATSQSDSESQADIDQDTSRQNSPSPTAALARWSLSHSSVPHKVVLAPAARLPPELLIHTLRLLSSPKDLHSALLVNKTWCECAVELLWHKPAFTKLPALFKLIQIVSRAEPCLSPSSPLANNGLTFAYPLFIRRLNFANLASDLGDTMFIRLASCTKLERLTLVNCSNLSDEVIQKVLACLPSLVALDLTGVDTVTDFSITTLAITAHRLQGINLGACKKVTNTSIFALAENCPLLRRVKLSGLELITDPAVSALATKCPMLLEIDLHGCTSIRDGAVRDLWVHSTHMRELRLAHCVEITEDGFPAPPSPMDGLGLAVDPFPSSTTPVTNGNGTTPPTTASTTSSMSATSPHPPLRLPHPFEHLRMLDLTSCAHTTDTAIEGIISAAPKIRNLVLAKCVELTDRAVESICRLGKHLHYLHMGHASEITDRAVRLLALHCTRLRYIDLACCTNLTDLSVYELSNLSKLRRVGLVRVNNLTDNGVSALAERYNTLERIHLSYCENITVISIYRLLTRLGRLTHLSLTGIPAFRRGDFQRYCRSPPREFNSAQRSAFCVYSGTGIAQLRRHIDDVMKQAAEQSNLPAANVVGYPPPQLLAGFPGAPEAEEDDGQSSEDEEHTVVGERLNRGRDRASHGNTGGRSANATGSTNGITTGRGRHAARHDPSSTSSSASTSTSALQANPGPIPAYDEPVFTRRSPAGSQRSARSGVEEGGGTESESGMGPNGAASRGRRTLRSKLQDAGAMLFGKRDGGSGSGSGSGGTGGANRI